MTIIRWVKQFFTFAGTARFAAIAPRTGDTTNVKPWLIVAIVAAVALVAITVWSSMHNKK